LTAATLKTIEILATVLGAAYAVLAARRNRLCWIAGAASSVLLGVLSYLNALPMQAALQVFYVGMAVYGWWNWTRASGVGELPIGRWPWSWHLGAGVLLLLIAAFNAWLLARNTEAAWPLLDSTITWFSLLATWLAARARLENWLYWIVIDAALAYLYYVQGLPLIALQFAVFVVIALGGYLGWRRRMLAQLVAA
jgi:nicotinamide mononucleotide transporter